MKYKISNLLIEKSWFEDIIHETLKLYENNGYMENSPLIEFQRNWKNGGGKHVDCEHVLEEDYENCIQKRQKNFFKLYESIKKDGYNGSEFLCFFKDDGSLHVYDGHHRLSIMSYLGIEEDVNIETEWKGLNADAYSPKESCGFPLREKLRLPDGRVRVYQPIDDWRVADIKPERPDSAKRLAFILNNISGNSVLDVGCSEGYFTRSLLSKGYNVTSIEIDESYLSVARYLTTINNLRGNFRHTSWQDIIRSGEIFDSILYLSVLHNEINTLGEKAAFDNLKLLKGRVKQIFIEIPNIEIQSDWAFVFEPDKVIPRLEKILEMKVKEIYNGWRAIYMFVEDKKAESENDQQIIENVLGKYTLYLPKDDYFITRSLKQHKIWEENTTHFIEANLKEGQTFVDVGAHVGYFSVLASDIVGDKGQVFAFEPDAKNCEFLTKNIIENKCNNVNVLQMGLSDKSGDIVLYKNQDAGGHSTVEGMPGQIKETETIRVERGDDVLGGIPDMIKIDAEGGERAVLEGMKGILETDKPLTIIFESWDGTEVASWLREEYGFKEVLRNHENGVFAMVKNQLNVKQHKEKLVAHLIGNCDIPTVGGGVDAFATKVAYMGKMLKEMGLRVFFYGVEGSEVECDEFIQVVEAREIREEHGVKWKDGNKMKRFDKIHNLFLERTSNEIAKRRGRCDLLLLSAGVNHQKIAEQSGVSLAVEIGIGYVGSFAPYRVFESNAWRHWTYGKQGLDDGRFCDCVIPPFFDPADFTYKEKKDNYFLYLGRVVNRKGVQIAIDTVKAIGGTLKIAGPNYENLDLSDPCIEYLGMVSHEEKRELLAGAKAILVPTVYLEPLGYTVIEAALSGTPVITTDFGAFNETVKHGVTGYRCRTFEHFAWAAKNIDNIKPSDCRNWGLNFSIDAAEPRYEEYFQQLLDLYGKGWYNVRDDRKDLGGIW